MNTFLHAKILPRAEYSSLLYIYTYIYIYIPTEREREAAFDCFVVRYVKNTKFEQDVTVNFISNHTFKNLQNYRTITDR